MTISSIDLYDLDGYVRRGVPHDQLAYLRLHDPVHWHQREEPGGRGYWAVTKYRDVVEVSKHPETYSSHIGGTLIPDFEEEHLSAMQLMILNMDPPTQTKLRRLVATGFTPRMVELMRPHVEELVETILGEAAAKGSCDFVKDIAAQLPLRVICGLLGVPEADYDQIHAWTDLLMGFNDPEFQSSIQDGQAAAMQMFIYAQNLAESRKGSPGEDLVSVLINAEVDGEKLTEPEFNSFFLLLAVGGNETTRHSTSHGMWALMEHPEEWRKLRENEVLLPSAVEEILRWTSPQVYFRRTAAKDATLGGKAIRKGEKVAMYYHSANRDEEVFTDPTKFDVSRLPNDHLSFGIGPHFCLGASLARLELQILFRELVRRFPNMELTGPVERLRSNYMNGIKRMPVKL